MARIPWKPSVSKCSLKSIYSLNQDIGQQVPPDYDWMCIPVDMLGESPMVLGKAAPRQSEICLSLECKAWQEVGLKIWSGSYGSYSSRRKTWCKLKHNPQGFTDFRNRRFPVPVASPLLGWRASHWDDPTLAVPPALKISLCKSAEISENLWILGWILGIYFRLRLNRSLTHPLSGVPF